MWVYERESAIIVINLVKPAHWNNCQEILIFEIHVYIEPSDKNKPSKLIINVYIWVLICIILACQG